MLLDSASMYFRAFYGVPDRFHGRDGTPTNAVRGFLDAIARSITQFAPDELIACWDDDWRPAFRVALVPSYKAHRVVTGSTDDARTTADDTTSEEEIPDALQVQEPIMRDVLAAIGIARVGSAGFEADDVIAHYARGHRGPVDIVSGDRDLFQLVDDARAVRVIYTAKGMNNLQLATDEWLRDKYGVTGHQYADMSLLRGDSSDGLPGVVGVGEKTAASLVDRFGGIEAIMAAAAADDSMIAPGLRRKLLTAAEYITAADQVVRLTQPVPVPDVDPQLPAEPADPDALVDLADRFDLDGPINRLLGALRV